MKRFSREEMRKAMASQLQPIAYIGHIDITLNNNYRLTVLFDEMISDYSVPHRLTRLADMAGTVQEYTRLLQQQETVIAYWEMDRELPRKVARLVDKAVADLTTFRRIYEVSMGRQANW